MTPPAFGAFRPARGAGLPPRARLLDPNRPGPATVPTAYNSDGLIVSTQDAGTALAVAAALRETLQRMECDFDGPSWLAAQTTGTEPTTTSRPAPRSPAPAAPTFTSGIRISPLPGRAGIPDPWTVLTELRAHPDPDVARSVGLNHVLSTAEQVGGNPFAIGHGRVGLDSYGVPGSGGRGPLTFVGPPPQGGLEGKRPRVVLLDTAVGEHPWFAAAPPTARFSMSDGRVVGDQIHPYPREDGAPTADPIPDPMLGTLGTHTGHGTFISGLLRQACPDVQIVALPVMGADGMVPEHMLIRALDLVLAKQLDCPGWADAVVMSLGYYNENPDDVAYSSGLKALLVRLGRTGVVVFAAAGNDATDRPSYPAAFAVDPEFAEPGILPVVSVAALNPDGTSAAFSNNGPWVTAAAPGVNLLSIAPTALDGSGRPQVAVQDRASIDLDSFRGGFAAWSGTSFAAPVLAGRYLRALADVRFPDQAQLRRAVLEPLLRRKPLPANGSTVPR